jgi:hypothetical protein
MWDWTKWVVMLMPPTKLFIHSLRLEYSLFSCYCDFQMQRLYHESRSNMKKWVFNVLKDKLYLERVCAKMIHLLHICFEGLNTINKKMKANYGIEECISFIAYICVTTILKSPYCKAYFIVIIRRFCNEMRKIATC